MKSNHKFIFVAAAVLIAAFALCAGASAEKKYDLTWESLDSRPIPAWYDDAKFGIFIHWGDYAVPSFGEWYWYQLNQPNSETQKFHNKTYGEKFKYQDFAPMFKAELFDPDKWADVFVRSTASTLAGLCRRVRTSTPTIANDARGNSVATWSTAVAISLSGG